MFCSVDCKQRSDFHYFKCSEFKLEQQLEEAAHDDFLTSKVVARILAIFDGSWEELRKFLHESFVQNPGKQFTYFDFDWNDVDERTREKNLLLIFLSLNQQKFFLQQLLSCNLKSDQVLAQSDEYFFKPQPVLEVHPFFVNANEKIQFKGEHRCNKILNFQIYLNYYGEVLDPIFYLMKSSNWGKPNVCCLPVSNKLVFIATTKIKAGSLLRTDPQIGYPTDGVKPKECTYDPKQASLIKCHSKFYSYGT